VDVPAHDVVQVGLEELGTGSPGAALATLSLAYVERSLPHPQRFMLVCCRRTRAGRAAQR
jgi:hypothetical protein